MSLHGPFRDLLVSPAIGMPQLKHESYPNLRANHGSKSRFLQKSQLTIQKLIESDLTLLNIRKPFEEQVISNR